MLDVRDAIAVSALLSGFRRSIVECLQHVRPPVGRVAGRRLEAWLPLACAQSKALRDVLSSARRQAEASLAWARDADVEAVPFGDARYQPWLAVICDPPPVLWVQGRWDPFHGPRVAIVGSRAASSYAIEVAERLAETLADQGVTVVSGLACGVDDAAHKGAMAASGGRTVAVLGSGIDVIYPPEHRRLAAKVAGRGGLVSEFLPGTPPRPAHFPSRNRIISGLSRVVVVEASDRSGALITAGCALDQGARRHDCSGQHPRRPKPGRARAFEGWSKDC